MILHKTTTKFEGLLKYLWTKLLNSLFASTKGPPKILSYGPSQRASPTMYTVHLKRDVTNTEKGREGAALVQETDAKIFNFFLAATIKSSQ